MKEKVRKEVLLFLGGIPKILKYLIYGIVFLFFLVAISYLWIIITNPIQREKYESIGIILRIILPLILTIWIKKIIESKIN